VLLPLFSVLFVVDATNSQRSESRHLYRSIYSFVFMKTLTVAAARKNLSTLLKQTLEGEDIGVLIEGRVVAFRPVNVYSEDYATVEYDVSDEDLDAFTKAVNKELDRESKQGKLKPFTGKLRRC